MKSSKITVGEIVAYRCWRLERYCVWPHDYCLSSTVLGTEWEPQKPMLALTSFLYGGIGVHAWKTLPHAIEYGRWMGFVIGTVYLWGEVIEHEWGYQAEYASIRSIDGIVSGWPTRIGTRRKLRALRSYYGVESDSAVVWDLKKLRPVSVWEFLTKIIMASALMSFSAAFLIVGVGEGRGLVGGIGVVMTVMGGLLIMNLVRALKKRGPG